MLFDWTINLGSLFTILANSAAVMGGVALVLFTMKADIGLIKKDVKYIESRLATLSEGLKQLSEILTKVAIQDTRLNMLEKYIDELRHGQGFIHKE